MTSSSAATDLTHTVTAFHQNAEWTGVRDAERDKWLELRKSMLTASDFAAILGVDPHKDALAVYLDKVTERKEQSVVGIDSPMFWGKILEQPILRAVSEFYGWSYRPGGALLRSRRHPFIGATLDAEIDRHDGWGWVINECKNTEIHRDWDEETEDCPLHVMVQCQVQLLVTDAPEDLCFALLSRYRPVQIHVKPNRDFHEVLVEKAEAFMEKVSKLQPPPATALSGKTLNRLFPKDDGTMVTLTPEALEWTKELLEIGENLKKLELREEELRNCIKQLIGASTFGLLPEEVGGKTAWRWLHSEREGHYVKPSSSRTLLLLKEALLPGEKRKATPRRASVVEKTAVANDVANDVAAGLIRMPGKRRR